MLGVWALGWDWNSIGIFETCFAVVLTIGIFTWTLAGFSTREAERKVRSAEKFAEAVGRKQFGRDDLHDWHRQQLAEVLKVREAVVEQELLLWLVEIPPPGTPGSREALVVTQRLWFLRLVGRGRGGKQTIDLATGQRLAEGA